MKCGLAAVVLVLIAGCSGCDDRPSSSRPAGRGGAENTEQWREELLGVALDNLNRLEEFNSGKMFAEIIDRLNRLDRPQNLDPGAGDHCLPEIWPQPEMLRQIVSRLNQWVRSQESSADWRLDPLVADLPEPLRQLSMVRDLGKLEFTRYDGFALREAVWLRDVSNWAAGQQQDDLARAKGLFDWTVRNIQLDADRPPPGAAERIPQTPWETLFFGRGTAMERAWVFILLARQQRIDAAVLAVADAEDPAAGPPKPWAVAVLIEGQLYLFEPALGLPIPAPDGIKTDEAGALDIRPATLAQLVANDALLRQLDVDAERPYAVRPADLERVVALVEASPAYLAARFKLIESRLAGQQTMVLSTAATSQAERFGALPHVAGARLWRFPYETISRQSHLTTRELQQRLAALLPYYGGGPSAPLRTGRMLYLKGKLSGQKGATEYLLMARPPNRQLADAALHPAEKQVYLRAKLDASYWLGLIAQQRANYPAAVDYFIHRTLEALPNGPWTHGAKYNLARIYETSDERKKAVMLYRSDSRSPSHHGNLLRARWLESQLTEAAAPEEG